MPPNLGRRGKADSLSTHAEAYFWYFPSKRALPEGYRESKLKSNEDASNQLQVFEACFTLFFIGETWWIEPAKNSTSAARRKFFEPAEDAQFDPTFDGLFSLWILQVNRCLLTWAKKSQCLRRFLWSYEFLVAGNFFVALTGALVDRFFNMKPLRAGQSYSTKWWV